MQNHMKAVRKAHRFTLQQTAEGCGVAFNTMRNWESGAPTIPGIERLLLFYQVHGYPVKFTDLITLEITSIAETGQAVV
ncbi:helix-turn-helix domain-containing protein [uncultured Paraglaciecola sp.]|uniref:helix-turn-helix domain-containing protein n=1 Tax=uncultured Paraglaciecola sp. TaxID=1765024 RepID=UPI002602E8F7|nr:helix-turn-helix domain-containing protein [uncultured Paraglaciecola sp.]